jgi:hypothetical protein
MPAPLLSSRKPEQSEGYPGTIATDLSREYGVWVPGLAALARDDSEPLRVANTRPTITVIGPESGVAASCCGNSEIAEAITC